MKDMLLRDFADHGLRFSMVPIQDGYVRSEDCRLYFAVFGTGRPVLLLHGGLGNGTNWAKLVPALVSGGYQAIVMDTRAHGRSTRGIKPLSYGLFAKDAATLLTHLGLQDVQVLGWSDGACTALELARTRPELVKGVVFFACNVDPSGLREFSMTPTIENCLKRHGRDYAYMHPGLEPFEDLQPLLEPMQNHEPNYSLGDLRSIKCPVSVLQGSEDEFIKLEHGHYLAGALARARMEVLPGLSHFAPIQDPGTFNETILRLLDYPLHD